MRLLLQLFFLLSGAVCVLAQMRAITSDGDVVTLYPDGTWEYFQSQPTPCPSQEPPVNIEAGATGKRVAILLNRQICFVLNDGQIEDLLIYDRSGVLAYSYRDGEYRLPYGWRVQYDLGSERVRKVGPYDFKYHWHTGQLERVGAYEIDYHFSTGRIEEIGDFDIEYDFMTGCISEVGDIEIEYDFSTKGVKRILGYEDGVEIYFLRDGNFRPRPRL